MNLRPIARAVSPVTRRNVRLRGVLTGLLLGALHIWTPTAAQADDAGDAKDLFAQGRQLRAHGDCTNALPLFRKAYEIYPVGLGSLRNLAECQEALGHFASARGAWLDLGRALQQHAEPRYAGWDQDAERGAARMAPKVATLTVEVTGTPSGGALGPDGLEVTLNGEPMSPSLLGTALKRDPGKVLIRVTGAQMSAPREQWVELSAGQVRRVVVDLSVAPAPPSHALAKDKAERTAAWVGIGVGAAGLLGAGIAALVRQSAIDDLKRDGCVDQGGTLNCVPPTPSTAPETADRGRVATTLANVFAVVGGATLAGGLVLLAVTPSRSPTDAVLVLSPSGVSAIGRF